MTEAEIAAQLKNSIPEDSVFTPAPIPEQNTNNGQATIAPDFELDEITQYKLHDLFGAPYQPTD